MQAAIYFTRHGEILGQEDELSEAGKEKLVLIRQKLLQKHFDAKIAFATDKNRTVESALQLAPKAALFRSGELRVHGNVSMIRKFHADTMLKWILERVPEHKQALVVNHDATPAVLALRFAEMKGAKVDWENKDLLYKMVKLGRGQGVLVIGALYEFIYS